MCAPGSMVAGAMPNRPGLMLPGSDLRTTLTVWAVTNDLPD